MKSTILLDSFFFKGINALLGNEKEKSEREALFNLKKASENGNGYASYLAAILLENGQYIRNVKEAIEYYEKASEQGNSYGINRIALYYKNNYKFAENLHIALEYFHKRLELRN